MLKLLPKFLLILFFWGIFILVILQIPYPNSLTDTSALQLLAFFVPLTFALSFTINLFLKFLPYSFSISLGIILLLLLKALSALNIVTGVIIVLAVGLLISYFSKIKKGKRLTTTLKIPRLTRLRKKSL